MLSDDLSKMLKGAERLIAESVVTLEAELIRRTPVKTGDLKGGWDTNKLSDGSYLIFNSMNYADVVLLGRRPVPAPSGKMMVIGSEQLVDGVAPIIQDANNELHKRLDLLKA